MVLHKFGAWVLSDSPLPTWCSQSTFLLVFLRGVGQACHCGATSCSRPQHITPTLFRRFHWSFPSSVFNCSLFPKDPESCLPDRPPLACPNLILALNQIVPGTVCKLGHVFCAKLEVRGLTVAREMALKVVPSSSDHDPLHQLHGEPHLPSLKCPEHKASQLEAEARQQTSMYAWSVL